MTARYTRASDVLWRTAEDHVVLLPLRHGELCRLTGSGSVLWTALSTPRTVDELIDEIGRLCGVAAAELRPDIESALTSLASVAAVEVGPA